MAVHHGTYKHTYIGSGELSFQSIFILKHEFLLKKRNYLKIFLFYGRPHDPGLHDKVLCPYKLSFPLLCSLDGTQQDGLMAPERRGRREGVSSSQLWCQRQRRLGADLEKKGGCSGRNPLHWGKGKSVLFSLCIWTPREAPSQTSWVGPMGTPPEQVGFLNA